MASKTSICNKALKKIGIARLLNVDTDGSKQASECRSAYDDVLLELLRLHNWNFAINRATLNKDNTAPVYGFANRFILPTIPKLIKLIEVENNPEFALEGNFLLTDESSINIKFIGKQIDVNKYDSLFINLFASRLATEIAYTLTADKKLSEKMMEETQYYLSLARSKDMQEDQRVPIMGSRYNSARLTTFSSQFAKFEPLI